MNRLIIGLALIMGSFASVANASAVVNEEAPIHAQGVGLVADNQLLGQRGVDFLEGITKGSRLYAFLLMLDTNVPEITKQIEFVALFNELHFANENLLQLLAATEKNNKLLKYLIHEGEL